MAKSTTAVENAVLAPVATIKTWGSFAETVRNPGQSMLAKN